MEYLQGLRTFETKLHKGSMIEFGRFPFDNDQYDPVMWVVAEIEGNKALLVSRYVIHGRRYNYLYKDVSWEISSVRKWLYGTFYENAFTDNEKARIRETWNETPDNPILHAAGGNDTLDLVFLLSAEEAERYLKPVGAERAKAAPYAEKHEIWTDHIGNAYYWLRSPGFRSVYAAYAKHDGSIDMRGLQVSEIYGVRPAMWVDLSCPENITEGAAEEAENRDGLLISGSILLSLNERRENVEIPEGIREIADYAFYKCMDLRSVTMPSTIEKVGIHMFDGCRQLERIYAPGIDISLFGEARMKAALGYAECTERNGIFNEKIHQGYVRFIRRNRKQLYQQAIRDGYLIRFIMREGLIGIDEVDDVRELIEDFGDTDLIASFVDYTNSHFTAEDYDRQFENELMRDPFSVTEIRKSWKFERDTETASITGYKGNEEDVYIPDHIGNHNVTAIEDDAFGRDPSKKRYMANFAKLRSVWVPEGVKSIGSRAFAGCPFLESLTLPDSLEELSEDAFAECRLLQDVYFPGREAFERLREPGSTAQLTDNTVRLHLGEETVICKKRIGEDKVCVGDIVLFGEYPYDADGTRRAMEWQVLTEAENGDMLLLSRFVIDARTYHYDYSDIDWENCGIRRWLGKDFYDNNFSDSEKSIIIDNNAFLLSADEIHRHLPMPAQRQTTATPFALKRGQFAENKKYASWWVRTPLRTGRDASRVISEGTVNTFGNYIIDEPDGVRPAIWIRGMKR